MKRKLVSMVCMASLGLSLMMGCGSAEGQTGGASEKTETAEDDSTVSETLQKYRKDGFKIGADLFAPYIYEDGDGNMTGVDYDILTTILTELGITDIKVVPTAYESVFLN